MQPSLELRSFSQELKAHQHDFHQLVLPVQGQLEMTLEGRDGCATESCLALVSAGVRHGFAAPTDNCFVIADIPTAWMQGLESWPAFQTLDEPLRQYVRFLYAQLTQHGGGAAERHMLMLLLQLLQQRQQGAQALPDQRMQAVRSYIEEHFAKPLTLTQLAAVAHLSVRQLSSRFRQLSNDIAHELRTPVARSLFRLQALQDQLDLADHHPLLVGIRRDLHNLNALTAEILSHAQLEYSQDWQFIEVELQPMLEALISELSATSAAQVELQSNYPAVLLAEPTQLMRALNNLISNALRYGQGKVLIRTMKQQDGLQLSVEDDGPGIAKEHRDHVWQAFYRVDSSRPRNHPINNQGNNNSNPANATLGIEPAASQQGFGLGLAMVKRIIEAHQGQVSIHRSQRLGGCEVRLQLPVVTVSQSTTHPVALIHS